MRIPYRPAPDRGAQGQGVQINPTLLQQTVTKSAPLWEGFGNIAEAFGKHAEKLQDIQNKDDALKIEEQQSKILADFESQVYGNQDPESIVALYDETVVPQLQATLNGEYSPLVRDEYQRKTGSLINQTRIDVASKAAMLKIDQYRERKTFQANQAMEFGDFDGARGHIDELFNENLISDVNRDKQHENIRAGEVSHIINTRSKDKPADFLRELEKSDMGFTPAEHAEAVRVSQRELENQQIEIADDLLTSIGFGDFSNEVDLVNTPEFLSLEDGQGLEVLTAFRKNQKKKNDAEYKALLDSDDYQDGLYSELFDEIDRFDASEGKRGEGFIKIASKLSEVKNTDLRTALRNKLGDKFSGLESDRKSTSDFARKSLDDHYKTLRETELGESPPPIENKIAVRDFLDDGFLEDVDKLTKLGLTDDDIEEIEDKETFADKASEFKKRFQDSQAGNADPWDRQLANTFVQGTLNTKIDFGDTVDQEALDKFNERSEIFKREHGRARRHLDEYLRDNPDASRDAIENKLKSINKDIVFNVESNFAQASLLPPKRGAVINKVPRRRGYVENGYVVGTASTYWATPEVKGKNWDDNGLTSVGIKRKDAPWWTEQGLPTIALAPETAKAMGVSLPKKSGGNWDINNSIIEVTLPNGRKYKTVYAENGMFKNPNSLNKLIDFSEQFQDVAGIKRGTNVRGVKITPVR